MSKTYELSYTAERIDEMLKEVDEHTIYSDATTEGHGLMSATDKSKLDDLPTEQQIAYALNEKVDKVEGKGLSKNDYTDAEKESVASAYHKPQNGIPKTDLDSSVQTSLDKADTALQSFTETDPTVPSWAKQPNKPSYDYSEIGNTPDLSGFITKSVNDLTNYYLKSETYTKAEVAALIGAIQQFHYEIYATLPQTGQGNVLYLIGPTGSGSDRYEEYVYANNAFNKIGDTSIDLSGYVTTSALNTALADYTTTSNLTELLSNKADKVSNATNGNFAGLDANGNLTDSGKKASDFATASQGAKADTAILFVEQDKLTDQQRNTALANVSNQTSNSTTGKMGYKVLDPTKTFAEQVTAENTVYEIRDVFDLGGTQETPVSITLPAGSTLKFNGGMIKNGTIIGNNSTIVSSNGNIFDNVLFNGTFENEFVAEWLLPQYDANRDYTDNLTYVFNCGAKCIRFTSPYTYNVTSTIVINDDVVICSSIPSNGAVTTKNIQPTIKSTNNITVIEYHHRTGQSKVVLGGIKIMSGNKDVPDYSTPIVYIEMNASGWQGADIDLCIINNVKYIDYEGNKYSRYGMVGLEVNTLQGAFTLANIKGQFACYKGVYIHGDDFITDINIESRMECCYGGEINGSYIYLRGKFQTLLFPNNIPSIRPSKSFFYGCNNIIQESIVWDVNTIRGSLSSVENGVVNASMSIQNSLIENTPIIPNYPTEQSTSFINANCGEFLNKENVELLEIQCSQDDFTTILFTKDDFMSIDSLFSNFIKNSYNSKDNNGELANIAPFVKTSSLQNSNVDITKPLQIKITLRYINKLAHWLRLYSRYYTETLVVRRLYSDSSYTSIIDEKTYNPTAFSGGQTRTNRSMLCFLPFVNDNGYNELVITYSVNADREINNQSTYFLIGFNIFSFNTKPNRYISYETNRIYTDWIITRPNQYYSVYYPKTLVHCNQGFVIVAPTTLPVDMHILLKLYPEDGLSNYISKTQRDCVIVVKTNGNVTITGLSGDAAAYKSNHEISGLSYYRFLMPHMFCSVLQIKGKGIQLEGFKRVGDTSVGTNQTNLSVTKCYAVSTSTNRPTLVAREVGYQYFDTTLGKPIWWNGTDWVDSTGTVV